MNNAWAIVIAGGCYFVWGGVWYGALGRSWMGELSLNHEDLMPRNSLAFITAFVGCMVNAWALNEFLTVFQINGVLAGSAACGMVWLTITAATAFKHYCFAGWSFKLFGIDYGGDLVGYLIMGALLNLPLHLK